MTRRQQIVTFLAAHPWAKFPELRAHLNTSRSNASSLLAQAIEDGVVVVRGSRRLYEYALANSGPSTKALANSSIFNLAQQ